MATTDRMTLTQGGARTTLLDLSVDIRAMYVQEEDDRIYWPNFGKMPPSSKHQFPAHPDVGPSASGSGWKWMSGALSAGTLDRRSGGSNWTNARFRLDSDRPMLFKIVMEYSTVSTVPGGERIRDKSLAATYLVAAAWAPPLQLFASLPFNQELEMFAFPEQPERRLLRIFDGPALAVCEQSLIDQNPPHGYFAEEDPWHVGIMAYDREPPEQAAQFHWVGAESNTHDVVTSTTASGDTRVVSVPREQRKRIIKPRRRR